jgi:hypothetical protein
MPGTGARERVRPSRDIMSPLVTEGGITFERDRRWRGDFRGAWRPGTCAHNARQANWRPVISLARRRAVPWDGVAHYPATAKVLFLRQEPATRIHASADYLMGSKRCEGALVLRLPDLRTSLCIWPSVRAAQQHSCALGSAHSPTPWRVDGHSRGCDGAPCR